MSDYDLNLPVIRGDMTPSKVLSMDEYQAFIEENLRHFPPSEEYRALKNARTVNVPFLLDD